MSDQNFNFALDLLSSLCLNEKFSDVHFKCVDESIPAHKTILRASSPFFENLLLSEENKEKSEFDLDCKPEIFKYVLGYIYTGKMNVEELSDNDVIGLFTLIQKMELPRLLNAVTKRMNTIEMSVENVGLMYEPAVETKSTALLLKCWRFMDKNAENIVDNKGEFAKFSPKLIREIVNRDSFEAPEIKIFEALVYWREQHENIEMPEVFRSLRLNLIKADEYAKIVRPTRLIADDDYFSTFSDDSIPRKFSEEAETEDEFKDTLEFPRKTMQVIKDNISKIRIPANGDKVYKDECVYSFDSPECETGLYVCLNTFLGVGKDFLGLHNQKTGNQVFLHILRKKIEDENADGDSGEVHPKKITKLGIGIEGGYMPESSKIAYEDFYSIVVYPSLQSLSLPNKELPEVINIAVAAIQAADSASRLEELQAAAGTWDGEKKQVSKYAENLVQLDNGVKVSPRNWKCSRCDLKENLWMNLTDGTILCGRKFFDGSGGNNHAVEYYQQTKYPLAVKLGTITPNGGDVYSYAEDDMVEDPYLAKHLAHFGICIAQMEKTDKSMLELELDYNQRIGEWAVIQESDSELSPLCGPGYTGLVNLGNSCYLNSVLQVLFSIDEFSKSYFPPNSLFESCPSDPSQDFNAQMAKVAYGLLSGKYSIPAPTPPNVKSVDQVGIKLNMFKSLVGKGHQEFSTKRQQDAQEFLLHLINLIERNNTISNSPNPAHFLKHQIEERVECSRSNKVSYMTRTEYLIPLPIPLDKATNITEVLDYEERKRLAEANNDTSKIEIVRPQVPLEACFDAFISPETVGDFYSTAINAKTTAYKSTKLKSFPDYLMIQLKKFTFDDNWVPKKLDVAVEVPDRIDLSRLRATGLQPHEEKLPDFKPHSSDDSNGNSSSSSISFDSNVLSQLCEMGFSVNACKRAMFNTQNTGVESALNWLFEHQADADINDPFGQESPSAEAASGFVTDLAALEQLKAMGLPEDQCKRGLKETDNNVERAIDWIFCHQEEFATQMDVDSGVECIAAAAAAAPEFSDGSEKYKLLAFISHMGNSTLCGHYVCHILKDGKWVIFNDNKVAVSEKPPKHLGYLYLYKRI